MPADLNDALSAGLNPDPGRTHAGEASAALRNAIYYFHSV